MRYIFLSVAVFAALLILSGCTQNSASLQCGDAAYARLPNCIYIQAVMAQDPYYCYSIPSAFVEERKICIKDSSDSNAKKILERMSLGEREKLLTQNDSQLQAPELPFVPPTLPSNASNASPTIEIPIEANVSFTDNSTYTEAVQKGEINQCEEIVDKTVHDSCIAQIATKTRNVDICNLLSLQADRELCRMYAQAQ